MLATYRNIWKFYHRLGSLYTKGWTTKGWNPILINIVNLFAIITDIRIGSAAKPFQANFQMKQQQQRQALSQHPHYLELFLTIPLKTTARNNSQNHTFLHELS